MTMTHLPASPPTGLPPDPGSNGRQRGAGHGRLTIRLTSGGWLLGTLAAAASAVVLPDIDPGRPAYAYLLAAAGIVSVVLGSLILHELGHVLVARRYGVQGSQVTVGFFGGLRHGREDLPTPRAQGRVAAAGPAVSLLLAGIAVAALAAAAALAATPLWAAVFAVAIWVNGLLGLANLIPGASLDGGRIVRALAWARSGDPTRAGLIAARFGQVTGAVLAAAGLAAVVLGHLTGLWAGLIGLLMVAASRAEAGQVLTTAALSGLRVRDILPSERSEPSQSGEFSEPGRAADPGQPAGPGAVGHSWQSVQAFLDSQGWGRAGPLPSRGGSTAFGVLGFDGQLAGLVTLSQLAAVPAALRAAARLGHVATPVDHLTFTTLDEPLTELRTRLSARPASPAALHTMGHAIVLGTDGQFAGVLTPADFAWATQAGVLRRDGRPQGVAEDTLTTRS